jgi:hypothetical protein
MRIRTLASACAALVLACSTGSVAEPQLASPSDGRAMLDRAIAALKADEATALKAFNDEKNKDFRDRDLYVYCFSLPDGNITAYQSPVMIGTNVKEFEASPEQSRWPTRLRCDHKGRRRRDCQLYLRFPQAGHQGTHAQGNARSPSRQAGLRRQLFQGVGSTAKGRRRARLCAGSRQEASNVDGTVAVHVGPYDRRTIAIRLSHY